MPIENVSRENILGIVGSPRRGGNTDILVDEALAGAAEAGALTEKVFLNDLKITPCQGCDACQKTRICVQHDDMPALLEQMGRSQVWVLGTPVYWWGPTAQFKAFLDRWYGAPKETFLDRSIILVIPLGDRAPIARHTVGMFMDALHYLRIERITTIVAPGVLARGDVRRHTDVLANARRVGREVFETVK